MRAASVAPSAWFGSGVDSLSLDAACSEDLNEEVLNKKLVSNIMSDFTETYKYSSILASLASLMTRSVCPESGHWEKYFENKIFTI